MGQRVYGVILAGGKGSRLWPLSSRGVSKSFARIPGRAPLVADTLKRLACVVKKNDIYFVVDEAQKKALISAVGNTAKKKAIVEPFGRSTASAVGLAALRFHPDSIMVVVPTDSYIADNAGYRKALKEAVCFCELNSRAVVCIGVKPDHASSSYGYIRVGKKVKGNVYRSERFFEKPDKKKAKTFFEDKKHLWNAGIFVFRTGTILESMKRLSPGLYKGLMAVNLDPRCIERVYRKMRNVSIDYQIMERYDDLYCVMADFGWGDLGNWVSLEKIFSRENKGAEYGQVMRMDTSNVTAVNLGTKPLAVIGMSDCVVVNSANGVLVCAKKDVEKVKDLGVI